MTIESLSTPWTTAPAVPAPATDMSGVDVLPGYASASTASTSSALSYPWSGQSPGIPQFPEVTSLAGIALSE